MKTHEKINKIIKIKGLEIAKKRTAVLLFLSKYRSSTIIYFSFIHRKLTVHTPLPGAGDVLGKWLSENFIHLLPVVGGTGNPGEAGNSCGMAHRVHSDLPLNLGARDCELVSTSGSKLSKVLSRSLWSCWVPPG